MNVKKLIIPTITMVIIASQLMGCAAVSQSELLKMINAGDQIEIEINTPINDEQGVEQSILWEELASLETNDILRSEWDDFLGIIKTDTGKNGLFYVDANGNNENNNTLAVVLHNRAFLKYLESKDSIDALAESASEQYADVELDLEDNSLALYMGINGYFNLLADATPNYSNPYSTLNRLEFMSMVMRAGTPVSEVEVNADFIAAVGNNDLNIYAQEVAGASYLDTESKSLNNMTANGTITRAEAIYLLMEHYFSDELANVDIKSASFSDAKDGGNIAEQQRFIEDGVAKDYWKSYELTYAVQNPDKGLPTDLYRALVLAKSKGLIGSETRWDEGITKVEAIEFIIETLKQDDSIPMFNATLGTVSGYDTTIEDETQAPQIESESNGGSYNPTFEATTEQYCTYTEISPVTLYTVNEGSLFGDPNAFEGELLVQGGYDRGTAYEVTAKTTINEVEYYAFTNAVGTTFLIPADCLSETAPAVETEAPSTQTETQQPSGGTSGSGTNVPMKDREVINDKYPAGSMASKLTDEQIKQLEDAYKDMGFSESDIQDILYATDEPIAEGKDTTGVADRDPSTYTDAELEAIRKASGMVTE